MVVRRLTNLFKTSLTSSSLILVAASILSLLIAVLTSSMAESFSSQIREETTLQDLSQELPTNTPTSIDQKDIPAGITSDLISIVDSQPVEGKLSNGGTFTFIPTHLNTIENLALIAEETQATLIPTITATKRDTLIIDLDGDGMADPGDTLRYTIRIDNAGSSDATGAVFSDTIDSHTTLIPGTLNSTPIARDDTYTTTINTPLTVAAANGLLVNDNDPDGGPVTITPFSIPTGAGGSVTVAADGSFSYTPASGYVGPDAFIYGAMDNDGFLDPATVFITVSNAAPFNNMRLNDYSITLSGETLNANLGTLNSGQVVVISFEVMPDSPPPSWPAGIDDVCNQGKVSGSNFTDVLTNDPDTAAVSEPTCTPIDVSPDLRIVKDDGGISVRRAQTIPYSLTYSNNGSQDATGVTIQETVPANTSFNAGASTAGWVCTPNNNAGSTCALLIGSVVGSGGGGNAIFAVTVNNATPNSVTQINNTAVISDDGANGTDPNPADNSESEITPLIPRPDLSLTKDDGGASATPGNILVYSLNYSNTGGGANGVVMTDTVPTYTTFNPVASTAGWTCSPNNNAGSKCTFSIGALAMGGSGSASFAVDVASSIPAGVTQLSNTAVIGDDGAYGPDTNPTNNSDSENTPLSAQPDMAIVKDDGGVSVRPGDNISYNLTYANNGNQDATGVILNETVPTNTTFNPGASTPGWVCLPDNNAGSSCILAIGAVASGGGGTAVFSVDVDNPIPTGVTQINNTAAINDDGSNGADPNPADNSASDSTPVIMAPDLVLAKDDGGVTIHPGDVLMYSLIYSNNGGDATGVALIDTVPAHTTFNPWTSTTGWICSPDNSAGSTCTLAIGSLAKGASGTAAFSVIVDSSLPAGVNQLSNMADIGDDGANGSDTNPANNSATELTPVDAEPDLFISKDDGGVTTFPGDTVAYSLTYANNGNQGATGVTLRETVPAHTTFNPGASTPGWVCTPDNNAGSSCTLAIGSLPSGGSGTAVFAVTVINPVPAGVTQIDNTAVINDDGANGVDPNPADNSDSDSTPVMVNTPPSNLVITISPSVINENESATVTGSFDDPDTADIHTVSIDWGDGNSSNLTLPTGDRSFTISHQYMDDDPSGTSADIYAISATVTDQIGQFASVATSIQVNNVPPQVGAINGPTGPTNINSQPLNFSAGFSDVGTLDSHTAVWDWGDGTTTPGTVSGSGGSGLVSDNHSYTAAGIYMVVLTLTDDDTGTGQSSLYPVIVFDPSAGFVTGGGQYSSPAGAYQPDTSLSGHANFGFVAKYHQGENIPRGNLQFQFQSGNLNFHATSFDWLIINGNRAQFQGSGTVNGGGNYGFIVTAVAGSPELFRLKIWDRANGYQLIYDTQPGAPDNAQPTLTLGGGSIVIH